VPERRKQTPRCALSDKPPSYLEPQGSQGNGVEAVYLGQLLLPARGLDDYIALQQSVFESTNMTPHLLFDSAMNLAVAYKQEGKYPDANYHEQCGASDACG
jgi:hypothetical protein